MATRHTGSNYVHELSIGASDLEQRYRDGEVGVLGSRQAASDLKPWVMEAVQRASTLRFSHDNYLLHLHVAVPNEVNA